RVGLLVARRHAAEVLHPAPEAFGQVALLVQVLVDLALLFARRERRDHRTGAHGLDRLDHRLAVVALVRYHRRHLRRGGDRCQQPLGVADVRLLAGAEVDRHRQHQPADRRVDLGAPAAPALAQSLLGLPARAVGFFLAPAAWGWARMMVLSSTSHSRSSSWNCPKSLAQTPLCAHRLKRFQTEFQLPKRSGRSRHGAPVLAIHKTASMNRRLFLAVTPGCPARPGSRSLMRSKSSSRMACRYSIAPSLLQQLFTLPLFAPPCQMSTLPRPARIELSCVLGTKNSSIWPVRVLMRATLWPFSSENHRIGAPLGAGVITIGRLLKVGMGNSVTAPCGVTRKILLPVSSVPHVLPSGPATT